MLDLWRRHIETTVQRKDRPRWVRPVIPYFTLLMSILLSIITATKVDPTRPKSAVVRGLWRANYALSLATVVIGFLYVPLCHFLIRLGRRGSIYLMFLLTLCFITALYRVIQLHTEDPNAPVRSRIAFYILEGATDWVCLAAILAINLNNWFPGELAWKKEPYEPDEAAMTAPAPVSRVVTAIMDPSTATISRVVTAVIDPVAPTPALSRVVTAAIDPLAPTAANGRAASV